MNEDERNTGRRYEDFVVAGFELAMYRAAERELVLMAPKTPWVLDMRARVDNASRVRSGRERLGE